MSTKIHRNRLLHDSRYQRKVISRASTVVMDRIIADVNAAEQTEDIEVERAEFDRLNVGDRFE
jgi:hypothetical protein